MRRAIRKGVAYFEFRSNRIRVPGTKHFGRVRKVHMSPCRRYMICQTHWWAGPFVLMIEHMSGYDA